MVQVNNSGFSKFFFHSIIPKSTKHYLHVLTFYGLKKILIVEDSNEILENTAEILQLAGYTVATAVNGVEGLKMAISEKPDLILCDIMMPQMTGSELLEELKKNVSTKNIPFLFFTASAEESEIKIGLESGAFDYIVKPFDPDQLVSIIKEKIGDADVDSSTAKF